MNIGTLLDLNMLEGSNNTNMDTVSSVKFDCSEKSISSAIEYSNQRTKISDVKIEDNNIVFNVCKPVDYSGRSQIYKTEEVELPIELMRKIIDTVYKSCR